MTSPPRPTTTRSLGTGCAVLLVGLLLVLSPLVLGNSFSFNKYLVAVGIIAVCLGLSFVLNATIDLVRGRGGGPQ